MNFIKLFSLSALVLMSGCSSMVITYDATGQVLGSCKATRGLLSLASAHCGGSGNALGVNYNTVDAKTGLLPVLPSQNQINLKP